MGLDCCQLSTTTLEREKRNAGGQYLPREIIQIRDVRIGDKKRPRSPKEWRSYMRQLQTDLKRVQEQEASEILRAEGLITQTRLRLRMMKKEATQKRRLLNRELERCRRRLTRLGEI